MRREITAPGFSAVTTTVGDAPEAGLDAPAVGVAAASGVLLAEGAGVMPEDWLACGLGGRAPLGVAVAVVPGTGVAGEEGESAGALPPGAGPAPPPPLQAARLRAAREMAMRSVMATPMRKVSAAPAGGSGLRLT